ncbi:DNA replication and repair protein RecF [Leucobacter komagatae]|uniref:DNA replication and repair protein RecF n=1 Tax=Leucobacter komagatae TaxID=55969 RepID=A0A542Y7Z7_9MICO|nr:DNA replication/repair protein RecF [Leucobacter komagatae]TQL44196.1 DNA replication and repair protein RecF [Leucobacter komagatae]
MRVAHLSLSDFRNYSAAELELYPGPNLIVGKNGQGKTNLAEAISYFATLRSHRVSSDSAMIRAGQTAAIMRMRVAAGERDVVLEAQINRSGPNRAQVNGNSVRARELTRWFTSIMFAPEDLSIVRGEPAGRRRFMDDALIARLPIAAGVLADYERVVRQRTSLLKSARGMGKGAAALQSTLEIWDEQLIEHGVKIMLARRELVEDLGAPLRLAYTDLVDADHAPSISLSESVYEGTGRSDVSRETRDSSEVASVDVSRETLEADFRRALQSMRGKELDRGVTLVGPHRDDLSLSLNDLPVRGYASHGESWSFALALKIALASVIRDESPAGDPVIILDDVFAELDRGRRERLMSVVSEFEQVIVTAAVESDVPEGLDWHRTEVVAGTLRERDTVE